MVKKSAIVILAGGTSSRYGSPKQLAKIGNDSLISIAIDNLKKLKLDIYVVLGANFNLILDEIKNIGELNIIKNKNYKDGMSSSIIVSVKELQNRYSEILFTTCDQPLIDAKHYERLLSKIDVYDVVFTKYDEYRYGIPACFKNNLYDKLLLLSGDKGAKRVIDEAFSKVSILCKDAIYDVDYKKDLEVVNKKLQIKK